MYRYKHLSLCTIGIEKDLELGVELGLEFLGTEEVHQRLLFGTLVEGRGQQPLNFQASSVHLTLHAGLARDEVPLLLLLQRQSKQL